MKKTYHLCLSAGDEVMFRDQEDFNRGFNCFALALYKTDSIGLVETFMFNHAHMMIETCDPYGFMHAFRQPYSKFFNCKYHRSGLLGEEKHFQLETVGLYHRLAAASYVLRNALHHGIAPIPYAYHNSSVNVIFQKEMGKTSSDKLLPEKSYYRFIGKRAEYPSRYKMHESGIFLRESVLDVAQVENMFLTPRAFDYYMTRKSGEDWCKEQEKDKLESPPVRLECIERGVNLHSLEKMMAYESGRANYRKMLDSDVCHMIDHEILPRYGKPSVYTLDKREKNEIAEILYRQFHIGEKQIRRCLAMLY